MKSNLIDERVKWNCRYVFIASDSAQSRMDRTIDDSNNVMAIAIAWNMLDNKWLLRLVADPDCDNMYCIRLRWVCWTRSRIHDGKMPCRCCHHRWRLMPETEYRDRSNEFVRHRDAAICNVHWPNVWLVSVDRCIEWPILSAEWPWDERKMVYLGADRETDRERELTSCLTSSDPWAEPSTKDWTVDSASTACTSGVRSLNGVSDCPKDSALLQFCHCHEVDPRHYRSEN